MMVEGGASGEIGSVGGWELEEAIKKPASPAF